MVCILIYSLNIHPDLSRKDIYDDIEKKIHINKWSFQSYIIFKSATVTDDILPNFQLKQGASSAIISIM